MSRYAIGPLPRASHSPIALTLCGLLAAGAITLACSGHGKGAKVPDTEGDPKRAAAFRDGGSELGPHHFFLADVPDGAVGPHWARGEGGGLVAYIGPPEVDARAIVVVKVNKDGEAKDPPQSIATAKVDANSILVRPLSKGYFVGWTELTDKGEALRAVIVNADGKATGKAFEIGRTSNDIVWFEVKQTPTGALVVWAESTKDGLATIVAQPLDLDGAPAQVAVRVAQGAIGWQLVASSTKDNAKEGAALFLTTPTQKGKGDVAVTMQKLGMDGQPIAAPIVVAASAHASGDVDAVRLTASWLVAWTDRSVGPSTVVTALVRDGAAGPEIAKLTDGTTASELVALGANGDDALIAWSEPSRKSRTLKNVYVAHASSKGVETARVSALETSARGVDLLPAGNGFAMSCEVVACGANGKPDAIGNQPTCDGLHPALVSLGKEGALRGRSLFSIGATEPGMAWDAHCDDTSCIALAAEGAGRTAHLHTVVAQVSAKSASQEPVAPVVPVEKKPLAADAQTITDGQSVADVAQVKLGDTDLVLVLKNSVDDATKKNGGAELSARVVDKSGALSPAQVLSTRALPVGGVAVAAAKKPEDGAVVAWVARENAFSQVHVTRVDKHGKKTLDALLTTTQADSSDVAIARVPQGYLVSWVDNRNKNGEVYATIINTDLQRIAREERLTTAPGDATDVTLTPIGEDVLVAWADTRDSTEDGFGDIYSALVSNHDAKKKGAEVRVLATAAHSRSPSILTIGDKIAVAWIEDVPAGQDGAPATAASGAQGAMLAFLDAKGAVTGSPARLPPSARGSAIAVTLGTGRVPSAVVARAGLDDVALDWFDLSHDKPSAVPLGLLDGPPSMDVSLALGIEALYFSDEGPEAKDRRARRLHVTLP